MKEPCCGLKRGRATILRAPARNSKLAYPENTLVAALALGVTAVFP